ncbi:hypothetical protein [Mycolicibacterium moriokaense]|uniref:hypothetical protein n=1 Tax=Mycolicibacterium moriokaense TaxID=39691 RepID=UPI001F438070|nr:hypothetical protein [Mycolicibacterium moriokaense]
MRQQRSVDTRTVVGHRHLDVGRDVADDVDTEVVTVAPSGVSTRALDRNTASI